MNFLDIYPESVVPFTKILTLTANQILFSAPFLVMYQAQARTSARMTSSKNKI